MAAVGSLMKRFIAITSCGQRSYGCINCQ